MVLPVDDAGPEIFDDGAEGRVVFEGGAESLGGRAAGIGGGGGGGGGPRLWKGGLGLRPGGSGGIGVVEGGTGFGGGEGRQKRVAASGWELDDDDAGERLEGFGGADDGGELGTDLDGGSDDVARFGWARFCEQIRVDRVVVGEGVRAGWERATGCGGGVTARIDPGCVGVAHACEGGEL